MRQAAQNDGEDGEDLSPEEIRVQVAELSAITPYHSGGSGVRTATSAMVDAEAGKNDKKEGG